MKNLHAILIFVLCINFLHANEPLIEKKKAPLSVALPLLETIEHHAIAIGSGPTKIYAFIDPLCPRSQDFVSMIVESEKMRKRYTYYFFYYELKRFDSRKLIAKIYEQKNPLELMKSIMVDHKEISPVNVVTKRIQKKIDEIAAVAEKLDIYKRPYLFITKPKKGAE